MQFVKPIPFREALDKIGDRQLVTSTFSSSQWADVPAALRERAFFSSRVESARFLQRGRDSVTHFLAKNIETLPNGLTALATGSRAQFVDDMQRFAISEGLGDLVPEDKRGGLQDITSQKRLDLIFDVQTRQAQDYGNWVQGQDPDALDAYPAQRFIRVQEVETARDWHQQFEGEVRLKTDLEFWTLVNADFGVPWGPWGWGCGHDVEDVERAEAEQLGLLEPGQPVLPAATNFNDRLEAGTKDLDPDLESTLAAEFGPRLTRAAGALRWTPNDF
jgi:hypothetical protein